MFKISEYEILVQGLGINQARWMVLRSRTLKISSASADLRYWHPKHPEIDGAAEFRHGYVVGIHQDTNPEIRRDLINFVKGFLAGWRRA